MSEWCKEAGDCNMSTAVWKSFVFFKEMCRSHSPTGFLEIISF